MGRYCDKHDKRMEYGINGYTCPDCEAETHYANLSWGSR